MGAMPENIDDWTMRADQRYLYQMVVAVSNGVCDERLASLKPGPLSTARWLTTASRILRLYVTKSHPDDILIKLTDFIVKVYAPFWFLVKNNPEAIHGSRNVFKYICWIRQLPMDVQLVIRPVIENNAYFLHPENILLSMVTDTEALIRSDAYGKINAARIDPPATIRNFYLPRKAIDFNCTSYTEMIDWSKLHITEPPCLQFFLQSELSDHQYSNEVIKIPGNNYTKKIYYNFSHTVLNDLNRFSMPFTKY